MRKDFFEHSYANLLDADDAVRVFGRSSIHQSIATVGDIRRAVKGHPTDASIYPENDGSGFYVTDFHGKFFTIG